MRFGAWNAVVVHTPPSPTGAGVTGGTFALDGKVRDYDGTITGGALVPLPSTCTRDTFQVTGTFAYSGGTGSFDIVLTHYGFRTRTGCVTYFATMKGSATFVDGAPPV